MKKFVVGPLVLVAALAVVVELVAPPLAESRLEQRARERSGQVAGVRADIDSFPMVTRLLLTERLRSLTITLDEVAGQQMTFTTVSFELQRVRLEREALLAGDVRVRDIDTGVVTAELDAGALGQALGAPVLIEPDGITIGGRDVPLPGAGGEDASPLPDVDLPNLPLPDELIPCEPDVEVADGRLRLSCRIDTVPFMLSARARVAGR